MRVAAVVAVSSAAVLLAASASGALFVTFEPAEADVGDTVTIRLGGTPPEFTAADGARPFGRPITVYLVSNEEADSVHDYRDRRLTKVATIVPDDGRGVARFVVPDLPAGVYWPAYHCPGCAEFSGGETLFAGSLDDIAAEYQGRVALTIGGSGGTPWRWLVPAAALAGIVASLGASLLVVAGRRAKPS
jgi:hypothetical protein